MIIASVLDSKSECCLGGQIELLRQEGHTCEVQEGDVLNILFST